MAREILLAELTTRVLSRADLPSSSTRHASSGSGNEVQAMIQNSATELYDLIVSRWRDYKLTSASLSTVATVDNYSLPTDFYKLHSVDLLNVYGRNISMDHLEFEDRNEFVPWFAGTYTGIPCCVAVWGNRLYFRPKPSSVFSTTLWYTPVCPAITDSAGSGFDGINGWEDWIIEDCAAKLRREDDLDDSAWIAAREHMTKRICAMGDRNVARPLRIQRTRGIPRGFRYAR